MVVPDTGQDNNATTIKLTQEDVENIKSLPKRTFLIGNLQQTGLYDEKTKRFYYLDANGEWNGRLAIINTPPPPPPNDEEPEGEDDSEETVVDGSDDSNESAPSLADKAKGLFSFLKRNSNSETSSIMEKLRTPISKKLPLTWMHMVIIGGIFLLLMIFVITPAVNRVFEPPDVPPASSTEAIPPSASQQDPNGTTSQTSEPDPTLSNIQVIQVKDIMIPGDAITTNNVQSAEISAADYELLRANGRILYQWDVVNNLIGMVVNKYIPKGGYIASGDESATYTPASNPWVNDQAGMTYVTLPLDETTATSSLLNFGSKADINITKKTTSQTTQQEDGTITTVTSEKKYPFTSVIICDIWNADQESIYPQYSAYLAIPAGERLDYIRAALLKNTSLEAKLTPAYIRIKIDSTIATEIGDFNSNNITIFCALHDANDIDVTSDSKREFASQARALKETIKQAIALNAEAAQQAQMEAQQQAQQ